MTGITTGNWTQEITDAWRNYVRLIAIGGMLVGAFYTLYRMRTSLIEGMSDIVLLDHISVDGCRAAAIDAGYMRTGHTDQGRCDLQPRCGLGFLDRRAVMADLARSYLKSALAWGILLGNSKIRSKHTAWT